MKFPSPIFGYLVLIGAAVVIGIVLLFLPPDLTKFVFLGIILIAVLVGVGALWRQGYFARLLRSILRGLAVVARFISRLARGILRVLSRLTQGIASIIRPALNLGSRSVKTVVAIFGRLVPATGRITRLTFGYGSRFIKALISRFTLVIQGIISTARKVARMALDLGSAVATAIVSGFRSIASAISRVRFVASRTIQQTADRARRGWLGGLSRTTGQPSKGTDAVTNKYLLIVRGSLRQLGRDMFYVVRLHLWSLRLILGVLGVPIGFVLICLAQYLPTRSEIVIPFEFLPALNNVFRFDLLNPDNVVVAIILFIVGGVMIGVGLRNIALPLGHAIVTRKPQLPPIGLAIKIILGITVLMLAILITNISLQHGYTPVDFLWLSILFMVALMGFIYDRRSGTTLSRIVTRRDIIYIAILLAVGLVICAYRLDYLPNNIIGDEGAFLERASNISQGNEQLTFFNAGVYTYPLASSFFQAYFFKIFGASLWSWRFSSAVIGVFAVIPTYLLALNMFNRRVAIAASIIMVTSAYFLAFSRMGYNNSQSIPVVALMLAFLYIGLQRQSLFYSALAGIAGGFGFYTYTAGRLALAFAVLFMGFLFLRQAYIYIIGRATREELDLKIGVRTVGIFLAAAILTVGPIFVYARITDPTTLSEKTLETVFPNVDYALALIPADQLYRDHPPIEYENQRFFFRPDLYAVLLTRGVVLSTLVMHIGQGLTISHYLVAPLPGSIAAIFYFIGLVLALWRGVRRSQYMALLLWLGSGLLFLSIIDTFPPRYQHLISVIPAIAILTAIGIVSLGDYLSKALHIRRAGIWITVSIVYICAVSGLSSYFVDAQVLYQPNVEDILLFHTVHANPPESVIYVTPQKDFEPYLLKFLPNKSMFHSTDVNGFKADDFRGAPADLCAFFFLPEEHDDVLASLQKKFPQDTISPVPYLDFEGRVILESWTVGCRHILQTF